MLVTALFTRNAGEPAIGLALGDIDIYLYARDRTTGVVTNVWNPQPPTQEIGGSGLYLRDYPAADHAVAEYLAYAEYTGAVALDVDFSLQSTSNNAEAIWEYVTRTLTAFGVGLIEYTYTLTDGDTGLPIGNADIWITTDAGNLNTIWRGTTDNFGVARDANTGKPFLDAGTYYLWREHCDYAFSNPQTIVVS